MSNQKLISSNMDKGYKLIKNVQLSEELQNYLHYQQINIQGGICFRLCEKYHKRQLGITQFFKRAFNTLNQLQKSEFFLMNAQFVYLQSSPPTNKMLTTSTSSRENYSLRNYTFNIIPKDKKYFTDDSVHQAQLNMLQRTIFIKSKQVLISMKRYLMRRIKSSKQIGIVLQSTHHLNKIKSLQINFMVGELQNTLNLISKVWEDSQKDNIKKLMRGQQLDQGTQSCDLIVKQDDINNIGYKNTDTHPQAIYSITKSNENLMQVQRMKTQDFENNYVSQISGEEITVFYSMFDDKQGNQNDEGYSDNQQQSPQKMMGNLSQKYFKPQGTNQINCLWKGEFQVSEKGGLLMINKQLIQIQKGVFKKVVKKLGNTLMSGKSIIHMSLPIQIFGHDSNLQRICQLYGYAPYLLDRASKSKNPIDRMKLGICFGITFGIFYIRAGKPFNPILGQTFEAMLDGCPVYAEQTSHHPPISSLFMKGRGYRIYGNFQPIIQIGFNKAHGGNQGFNTVEFDDKESNLKFNTPLGTMNGVLFGERILTFTEFCYFIDEKNRLFCKISWGKNKNSKHPSSKFNDFFEGNIYKVRDSVDLQKYKGIKKSDFEKDYGTITGRFTGDIYHNQDKLFNFYSSQPYCLTEPLKYLQSDSRNRKDIQLKNQNNLQKAQIIKQEMEDLQRRQAKLRKNKN